MNIGEHSYKLTKILKLIFIDKKIKIMIKSKIEMIIVIMEEKTNDEKTRNTCGSRESESYSLEAKKIDYIYINVNKLENMPLF